MKMTEEMTVRDLLERLSQYPDDAVLTLSGDYGYGASLSAWDEKYEHLGTVWEEK